mmetsp:Transcript_20328/g.48355  ORF Transcript_20328/g.48355 Transcript_20328/m.48355 type:complete len:138 (-) Transcript_20328:261-674(-)
MASSVVTNSSSRGKDVAISLYRNILRAHKRYLPHEMKGLGDSYVKNEFRLFKNVKDETQLDQFYSSWQQYLQQILDTARAKEFVSSGSISDAEEITTFGQHLPKDIELSEEQKDQLSKLKEESSKVGSPPNGGGGIP